MFQSRSGGEAPHRRGRSLYVRITVLRTARDHIDLH